MASITMSTSLLSGINVSQRRSVTTHRTLVVSNAASAAEVEQVKLSCNNDKKTQSSSGRRDLMFAAAAAAVCSIAGVAVAREEPKRGTPEAKKLYAPVCATMPTARICRK
ncbi:photosystem II 5 kDa protein, chloroplastic-like [Macadamia integrifolia]|uniref:photosystem II 5 kDa protein, chloroplastic-like n=1 Tax=Macadamia integrifolia TaxID=60698 RepID=UPI001C4EC0A8|nr:photosystem II 5 kDa protein, chloroplastic-like [Macadamia integrifolia]